MFKPILVIILSFFGLNIVVAQKADTVVYFLKSDGKIVSAKDSADFFLVILPPDTSVDKTLFRVKEYYRTGKIRFIANSTTKTNLKFQGPVVTFFPNGQRKEIQQFVKGKPVGDIIEYYPNGRFYNKKSYLDTLSEETILQFEDCQDSTGKVLAENGNGYWVVYNGDFTRETAKGKIVNGYKDSVWTMTRDDNTFYLTTYKNGKFVEFKGWVPEKIPEYPGGIEAFYKMLSKSIRYPPTARRNGTQGRVIVSFVIETDGSLINVKVARGIGDGCDEEAIRVIKLSSPWKPGIQNGKAVRVAYSVPVSFSLN
jgi:TonB family protein